MMKKAIVLLMFVSAGDAVSQNVIQQQFSNIGLTNQSVMQQQSNLVFASNVMNTNKTQQKHNVQRQVVQQVVQPNINPQLQIQNLDWQVQSNAVDNNSGNEMNTLQQIQQISNVASPQLQIGTGKNFELKLPGLQLNLRKTTKRNNSEGYASKHKWKVVESKIKKLNRNLSSKLSFKKRLKMKVDNCFKW